MLKLLFVLCKMLNNVYGFIKSKEKIKSDMLPWFESLLVFLSLGFYVLVYSCIQKPLLALICMDNV